MDDQNFEVIENNSWATPPMDLPKPPAPEPQPGPRPGFDPNFNHYRNPEQRGPQGYDPGRGPVPGQRPMQGQPPIPGQPPYPGQGPAPYYPGTPAGVRPPDYEMSVGDWLLSMLIMCIPIAGFVMLIVWAAETRSAKPARKNWAIASLIWGLISSVVLIGLIVLLFYLIYEYG